MDAAQTLAFARRFGEPIAEVNRDKRHGELPEVSLLNSTIKEGQLGGDLQFFKQSVIRSDEWHTDQSFVERPALATILHAHEVPSRGGATWFCDTRGAYDALPDEVKLRIDGLKAVHGYDTRRAKYRPVARSQAEIDETPDVVHPVVRTHPETGRKALYLNFNRLDHIVGMERAESDALLDYLADWVSQDRFHYRHQWSVGDAVVWDNRCTLHRVSYDSPPGERRVMMRVVTQGDRPF
jgi:taurine dioxygenase